MTSLSQPTCIWRLHYLHRRPKLRLNLCLVTTMTVWKPTVGRSSKRRYAEMEGTEHEHLKNSAFNELILRNCSGRKISPADSPRIPFLLPRKIDAESGSCWQRNMDTHKPGF